MKGDQVKRLRELEKENDRLKKMVADLSLDKAILNEAFTKPVPESQSGRTCTRNNESFRTTGMQGVDSAKSDTEVYT